MQLITTDNGVYLGKVEYDSNGLVVKDSYLFKHELSSFKLCMLSVSEYIKAKNLGTLETISLARTATHTRDLTELEVSTFILVNNALTEAKRLAARELENSKLDSVVEFLLGK